MQENCTLLGENLGYQSLGLVYGQLNLLLHQLCNTLRIPYISTVERINDSWEREWIRRQQGGQLQCMESLKMPLTPPAPQQSANPAVFKCFPVIKMQLATIKRMKFLPLKKKKSKNLIEN